MNIHHLLLHVPDNPKIKYVLNVRSQGIYQLLSVFIWYIVNLFGYGNNSDGLFPWNIPHE